MMSTSDWIDLFSLIISSSIAFFSLIVSSSIAFFALIVSGITAFYAYKVYQATQEQLELATSSAEIAEKIANEQLELARQDANNSAEAAKQQKFVSCVEMYIKFYDKKVPFFEQFIEKCPDKDLSKYCSSTTDIEVRRGRYAEIFNNSYSPQDSTASWAANKFICDVQPFINTVLALENQLNNQDERNKFYCIIAAYSNLFIESFEMVNSLENYTPANKTAFDNTQRVFNALQNKNK